MIKLSTLLDRGVLFLQNDGWVIIFYIVQTIFCKNLYFLFKSVDISRMSCYDRNVIDYLSCEIYLFVEANDRHCFSLQNHLTAFLNVDHNREFLRRMGIVLILFSIKER